MRKCQNPSVQWAFSKTKICSTFFVFEDDHFFVENEELFIQRRFLNHTKVRGEQLWRRKMVRGEWRWRCRDGEGDVERCWLMRTEDSKESRLCGGAALRGRVSADENEMNIYPHQMMPF